MAFTVTNPDDEKKKNALNVGKDYAHQQNAPAFSTSGGDPQSQWTTGTTPQASSDFSGIAPIQNGDRPSTSGGAPTKFVSFDRFLGANTSNAGDMAYRVASGVNRAGAAAQNSIGKLEGDFYKSYTDDSAGFRTPKKYPSLADAPGFSDVQKNVQAFDQQRDATKSLSGIQALLGERNSLADAALANAVGSQTFSGLRDKYRGIDSLLSGASARASNYAKNPGAPGTGLTPGGTTGTPGGNLPGVSNVPGWGSSGVSSGNSTTTTHNPNAHGWQPSSTAPTTAGEYSGPVDIPGVGTVDPAGFATKIQESGGPKLTQEQVIELVNIRASGGSEADFWHRLGYQQVGSTGFGGSFRLQPVNGGSHGASAV